MFETVSVGMMNPFTAIDLTYMNGKTDDMECHVKDKFAKEVLLCGSFGDIVDFSSSKMLVFEKLDTRRCFMLLHPKQKANRKFSNYQTGWTTSVETVFIFRWGLLPNI